LLPLNPAVFGIVLLLGATCFVIAQRRRWLHVRLSVIGMCALIVVSLPWLAATFSVVSAAERMKDVLPATTAACVLFGVAVGQVIVTLRQVSAAQQRAAAILSALVPLVVVTLVLVPHAASSVAILQNRLLPDQRVTLRLWADQNLDPGTFLVGSDNHKTFNPFWGGIEGRRWFDWHVTDDWTALTPAQWREQHGISYAAIERSDWDSLSASTHQAWLTETLQLRVLDPPSRSPQYVVVRLWGFERGLGARFGEAIRLVGADVPSRVSAAGDTLTFRFYWRADQPPADNYSLFTHLTTLAGVEPLAQTDGAPAYPERPTLTWHDTSETLISAPFDLALPQSLPAGTYLIRVGLYNYQSLARLPVVDASGAVLGDSLDLMAIEVR
jgi:hypothetical protein